MRDRVRRTHDLRAWQPIFRRSGIYAKRQVWVGTFRTRKRGAAGRARSVYTGSPGKRRDCRGVRGAVAPRLQAPPRLDQLTRSNAYMVKPLVAEFGTVKMFGHIPASCARVALRHRGSVPVVRAMFNDALNEECVTTNPFANLRLDQRRGRRRPRRAYRGRGSVRNFADTSLSLFGAYGSTFRACILFAAYVGLHPRDVRS